MGQNDEVWKSASDERLYELARDTGEAILHHRFKKIDPSRRLDLIHDSLMDLAQLRAADSPRAWFITVLTRKALSWLRRGDADVKGATDRHQSKPDDAPPDPDFVLDARRALAHLPPREQQVLWAVAAGESREELAQALGTSRANIDQIVSRCRRALRARGGEEP